MADLYRIEGQSSNIDKKRYKDTPSNQLSYRGRIKEPSHREEHRDHRFPGYRPFPEGRQPLQQRNERKRSLSSTTGRRSRRRNKSRGRRYSVSHCRLKNERYGRTSDMNSDLFEESCTSKQRKIRRSYSIRRRKRKPDALDHQQCSYTEKNTRKKQNENNRTTSRKRSNSRGKRQRRHSETSLDSRDSGRSSNSNTSASEFYEKRRKKWSGRLSEERKINKGQFREQRPHKNHLHGCKTSPTSSASSSCISYARNRHSTRFRSSSLSYNSNSKEKRKKAFVKSKKSRDQQKRATSRSISSHEKNKSMSSNKKKNVSERHFHRRQTHRNLKHAASPTKTRKRSCSTSTASDICSDAFKKREKQNKSRRRKLRKRTCNTDDSNSDSYMERRGRKPKKRTTRYCNSSSSSSASSSYRNWQRQRQWQRRRRNSSASYSYPPNIGHHLQHRNPNLNASNNAVVSDEEVVHARSKSISTGSSSCGDRDRDDSVGHYQGGPGSLISDRYEIVKDLGIGTFGRVLACLDRQRRRYHEEVAIKVVRDVKRYYESAQIEADILRHVNSRGDKRGTALCVHMLDHFHFLEGRHYCLVFESLGLSLYDFLKKNDFQPFPLYCIQDFAQQLLSALEFLHSLHLIHTDLKPENILLVSKNVKTYRSNLLVPAYTRIKVIDFGGATYDDEPKSTVINTRQYRAPEVILELPWSFPSDIWSLGCILAELYTGNLLFATHDNYEHLALIERAIGTFPRYMLDASVSPISKKVFDSCGRFRGKSLSPSSQTHVEQMLPINNLVVDEPEFLQLLKQLLVIDPHRRATASEALTLSFPKRSQLSY